MVHVYAQHCEHTMLFFLKSGRLWGHACRYIHQPIHCTHYIHKFVCLFVCFLFHFHLTRPSVCLLYHHTLDSMYTYMYVVCTLDSMYTYMYVVCTRLCMYHVRVHDRPTSQRLYVQYTYSTCHSCQHHCILKLGRDFVQLRRNLELHTTCVGKKFPFSLRFPNVCIPKH